MVIGTGVGVGVQSLVEIDDINRTCENHIVIDQRFQGEATEIKASSWESSADSML